METIIKDVIKKNALFTILLVGVFSYRHLQSNKLKRNLEVKSLEAVKVESLESGQYTEISKLQKEDTTIYLWATWCPPCLIQNKIIDFYDLVGLKKKEEIIKISLDENPKQLKKYLRDQSLKNHFWDDSNQFFSQKIIQGTPTMLTIDNKGEVKDIKMGINFIF